VSVPRYLWPADRQRSGYPFRDGEIVKTQDDACEKTKHLTLSEVLMGQPTWFIVLGQGRRVLGVYGSSLKHMAELLVQKLAEHGIHAFIEEVAGECPSVGEQR